MKKPGLPPIITLTNTEGKHTGENLIAADADGMLNLISNDLDYLLNRTNEVPPISDSHQQHHHQLPAVTPPPPVAYLSQVKSPAMLLQHDVIMEESEHEHEVDS